MKRAKRSCSIPCVLLISLVPAVIAHAEDCNRNGVTDDADIASGTSWDCDSNGVPDECDLTMGSIDFESPRLLVGDPQVSGLAVADFDGDGAIDVATDRTIFRTIFDDQKEVQGASIEVALNRGDGNLEEPVEYPMLSGHDYHSRLVAADLDSDGDADIFASPYHSTPVRVLINRGDGTFTQTVHDYLPAPSKQCLPIDLDLDGDVDIVSRDQWTEPTSMITVLRNRGDGTFLDAERFAASDNYGAFSASTFGMESADFDGDGYPDLALRNITYDFGGEEEERVNRNVVVLLNDGEGRFPSVETLLVGEVQGLVSDDFDGDGLSDLVVLLPESFSVYRSLGDGTFAEPVEYTVDSSGHWISAEDVDLDGRVDLITALRVSGETIDLPGRIAVFRNRGDGTFAAPRVQETTRPAWAPLEIADLNLDGLPDLAVSMYVPSESERHGRVATVEVLKNLGGGEFEHAAVFDQGRVPASRMRACDMDGDQDLDLVMGVFGISSSTSPVESVSVLVNTTGQGTTSGCDSFVRGDVNSDGVVSISDFIMLRRYLFGSGLSVKCDDAVDVSDDEQIDLCDALTILHALFLHSEWTYGISQPFPEPGEDPTSGASENPPPFCFGPSPGPEDSLGCSEYTVEPPQETDDLVQIGDVVATPGETVKLPIHVESSVPIDAMQLVLEYDPDSLEIEDGALTHESSFYSQFNSSSDTAPDRPEVSILKTHPETGVVTIAIAGSFLDEGFEIPPGRSTLVGWISATVSDGVPANTSLTLTPTNGDGSVGVGPYQMRNELSYRGDARLVSVLPQVEGAILKIVVDQMFFRGDSNSDGEVDLSDAQHTLSYLYIGGTAPSCEDAADANDDGEVDLSDAVSTLQHLYVGGPPPPTPFETCGPDATADGLHCAVFGPCVETN